MSRETAYVTDHWAHANVVQELGWRTQLAKLPLPKWKKVDAAPRDWRDVKFAVSLEALRCTFLAWIAALVGLSRMSDGSLPWEWALPIAAASVGGLLGWLQAVRWPPNPDAEPDTDPDVDEGSEDETEDEREPAKVGEVLFTLLLLPVLAVAALGAFALVVVAVVVLFVVTRGWPALAVVALLAVVTPYASLGAVGYTLIVTSVAALISEIVLAALQQWSEEPVAG